MAFPYRYLSKGIYRGIRVDQVTLRGLLFVCFSCFPQGHFANWLSLFILEFLTHQSFRASVLTPVLQFFKIKRAMQGVIWAHLSEYTVGPGFKAENFGKRKVKKIELPTREPLRPLRGHHGWSVCVVCYSGAGYDQCSMLPLDIPTAVSPAGRVHPTEKTKQNFVLVQGTEG